MKIIGDKTYLSASDLSIHIACPHATFLNLQEAKGLLTAPVNINAALNALQQKGEEFEAGYLEQLKRSEKQLLKLIKQTGEKLCRIHSTLWQPELILFTRHGWSMVYGMAGQISW